VPDGRAQSQPEKDAHGPGLIPRWNWRPGMKPRTAFNLGVLFSFVGLLFVSIGIVSLIVGILDSYSPPLQVPGVVIGRSTNFLDNLPHLNILPEGAGSHGAIAPAVSRETARAIQVGDHVILDYSPRLHYLYALESAGQRYTLPGSSPAGNPFGSVALITIGLVIFPYPAFLTLWGWRDLHQQACTITARVVDLHATKHTRASNPGLAPRLARTSYTVVLEPVHSPPTHEPMIFAIKEELYNSLRQGAVVQVTYSPNLHHVYALERRE
jgi:hypothetical protein